MRHLSLLTACALVATSCNAADIPGLHTRAEILKIQEDCERAWQHFRTLPISSLLSEADKAADSHPGAANGHKLLVIEALRRDHNEYRDLILTHVAAPVIAELVKVAGDAQTWFAAQVHLELLGVSHCLKMSIPDKKKILCRVLDADSGASDEQVACARKCLSHLTRHQVDKQDLSEFIK